MPVILATQEAEIRRIAVQSQPRQIFHKILSRKTLSQKKKIGLVEWLKVNALSSSPSTLKKKKSKCGDTTQVAEHLPNKCKEPLLSVPSIAKTNK
jgi:hypothetical protein